MRTEFLQVSDRAKAKKLAPWAYAIVKVEGGFMCFESPDDYRLWKSQR